MPHGKVLRHWAAPEPDDVSAWWLLERAMALLEHLMQQPARKALVLLPPEGATLREVERAALIEALEKTGWYQNRAAKLLQITPATMSRKMLAHDIYAENNYVVRKQFPNRISRWERARQKQEAP